MHTDFGGISNTNHEQVDLLSPPHRVFSFEEGAILLNIVSIAELVSAPAAGFNKTSRLSVTCVTIMYGLMFFESTVMSGIYQ